MLAPITIGQIQQIPCCDLSMASYTFTHSPRIYTKVQYMATDRNEGGSCQRFTDLPRISYRSPMDCHSAPRTGLQMKSLNKGLVFLLFFIRTLFPCQSVADPVRSGNILGDICWHGKTRMTGMPQGHPGWACRQ